MPETVTSIFSIAIRSGIHNGLDMGLRGYYTLHRRGLYLKKSIR